MDMRKRVIMPLFCCGLACSLLFCADNPMPRAEKRILFVCTGNYFRSRYAQALFNLKARETKLGWKAFSRGLGVKDRRKGISPLAVQELSKRGVPESLYQGDPRPLTQADLDQSDYIVVLDETEHRAMLEEGFPKRDDRKIHYWNIPDDSKMIAPEACVVMDRNIEELIKRLGASAAKAIFD